MKHSTDLTKNSIKANFNRLSEIMPFVKRIEKISIHSMPMWDMSYSISFLYNDKNVQKTCCFDDMKLFIASYKGFAVECISFSMTFSI